MKTEAKIERYKYVIISRYYNRCNTEKTYSKDFVSNVIYSIVFNIFMPVRPWVPSSSP